MLEKSIDLNHNQLRVLKDRVKKVNQEQFLEQSRKRLDKIISSKMTTCFIGALSIFEKYFGFLWSHGIDEDNLNETDSEMRELWKQTRNAVLNHGNNQLRAVQNEILNHSVFWNRYNFQLPVRPLDTEEKDK